MSDDAANINFRRILSGYKNPHRREAREDNMDGDANDAGHLQPNETSPLLANGDRDTRRPRSRQRASGPGHAAHDARPAGWKQFFFDGRRTPGRNNDNRALRWGASAWHVTKVTLLSSKFDPLSLTL
jgi:hypothetical protein